MKLVFRMNRYEKHWNFNNLLIIMRHAWTDCTNHTREVKFNNYPEEWRKLYKRVG